MSEVSWEDQQQINEFSKLNARHVLSESMLAELRKEKEYVDDTVLELELADEDELLPYRVADVFVSLPAGEVVERLHKRQAALEANMEARQGESAETTVRLAALKRKLYSKFGDAINLERD